MKVSITLLIFVRYVGCFQDTVGYIKILHTYRANPQRNVYILTI
jgi:hypothetical protein